MKISFFHCWSELSQVFQNIIGYYSCPKLLIEYQVLSSEVLYKQVTKYKLNRLDMYI